MRYIDDGNAEPLMNVLDLVLHLLAQLLVEGAEWLVHQHQVRLEDECARHGDALLLAAGELAGAAVAHLRQFHHLEDLRDPLLDLRLGNVPDLQREGEVLVDGHVREQRIVLEHHADSALVRRHIVDRLVLEEDLAVGGGLKARQHHERGGLAGAGRPQHGQELALGDVQVEVLDHQRFAVIALLHIDEAHHRISCRNAVCHSLVPSHSRMFLTA